MSFVGIYVIRNTVDNKVYVGKSININKRFAKHQYSLLLNTQQNKHLQRAWNKYGEGNFKFEILELCSELQLNDREIYWISKLNSTDSKYGYNKKYGGEGGKLTPDALLRMTNSMIGKKHSEKSKKHMSLVHTGHPVSMTTRNKISRGNKGKVRLLENKQRISATLTGRVLSIETRLKMSKAHKGIKQKQLTCPHCFKNGGTTMYRWHFDNCKNK
jgi:group I intron endonuclease